MSATVIKRTSFLQNLTSSIIGVFIGILLVIGAIVLLFLNEIKPNDATAAKNAVELTSSSAATLVDQPIWMQGKLNSSSRAVDTYLANADYIVIERSVQVFAWVETSQTREQDELGGGTTTITTYSYNMAWVSDPAPLNSFDKNSSTPTTQAAKTVNDQKIIADTLKIGDRVITQPSTLAIDLLRPLNLEPGVLNDAGATVDGGFVYLNDRVTAASLGDQRISFRVVRDNTDGLILATVNSGGDLAELHYQSEGVFRMNGRVYRVFDASSIQQVIALLEAEAATLLWILRLVGFVLMTVGFLLVAGPLQAIAGILPMLKRLTGAVLMLVALAISVVLSAAVIIVANILNNIFALIALVALVVIIIVLGASRSRRTQS